MKKFLPALLFFSFNLFAQVPQLPDLSKWEELTERDKAQAGAFFLFYDLAKSNLIGPGSGVCLNYEPGDGGAGSTDKISIALDSSQFELAKADGMALGQGADKVKTIFGKVKTYLDSGCQSDDCKKDRKVTVTGYADATRNRLPIDHQVEPIAPGSPVKYSELGNRQSKAISRDPSNPSIEESIRANTNLATRRASLYAELAKDFTDEVYVTANPSPIAEYLREGKTPPSELGGEGLKPGDLSVNCQARRRAVIDVEFNPHKIDVNSEPDTLGLNLSAGSKDFLFMSTMGASLQVLKQSMKTGSRDENEIIDAVLNEQGITDPEVRKGCKNEGTRLFVKESLKRTSSRTLKQAVASADESVLLGDFKDAIKSKKGIEGPNVELKKLYDELKTGGIASFVKDHKIIDENGFSSSLIDCFSVKPALKAEMQKNSSLRSQLCKSPKEFTQDGKLKLSYDPSEPKEHNGVHHIGCTGCGTGYNIAKNEKTGKYEGYILDRYYGTGFQNRAEVMKDHRPISRDEVQSYMEARKLVFEEVKKIYAGMTSKNTDKTTRDEFRQMELSLDSFDIGTLGKRNIERLKKHADRFTNKEKALEISEFLERMSTKALPKDVEYVKSVTGVSKDGNAEKYYEKVLYPSITTQKKLSGWGQDEAGSPASRMSFGGLKNPGYYVVPNCRCDDKDASVVDKAAGLRPTLMKEFPYNKEVPISDPENTCIFVPPVPASCSYSPSEKGLTTGNEKGGPEKIRWISGDGVAMEKTAAELAAYLDDENDKFGEAPNCVATDPFEKAQELLEKSMCQGETSLPTTEINDCGSTSGASRQ